MHNQPYNLLLTGYQQAHNTDSSCICLQNTIQTHLPVSLQVDKPTNWCIFTDQETGGMSVPCPGSWCKDFWDSTHGVRAGASSSTAISATKKVWPRRRLTRMQCLQAKSCTTWGQARPQQTPVTTLLHGRWALGPLAALWYSEANCVLDSLLLVQEWWLKIGLLVITGV